LVKLCFRLVQAEDYLFSFLFLGGLLLNNDRTLVNHGHDRLLTRVGELLSKSIVHQRNTVVLCETPNCQRCHGFSVDAFELGLDAKSQLLFSNFVFLNSLLNLTMSFFCRRF